jgi:hypothetical protein
MITTLGTLVPTVTYVTDNPVDGQDPGDGAAASPGADFAALMSSAAAAADPGAGEAPYGWTTDRDSGERRPKKTPGRPRISPSLDDLKTAAGDGQAAAGDGPGPEDRAPANPRRKRRKNAAPDAAAEPAAQHRAGVITKGVNRLYRRAGRIVRAMDPDIGTAIIESTRSTDEDGGDDSVGAAWEELARANPRIRGMLLRLIAGGAWGQLLMAHAPILLAVIMKDGIRKHIPFVKLLEALAEPDEDGQAAAGGLGGLLAGMTEADMQQMAAMAQGLMGQAAARTGKAAA